MKFLLPSDFQKLIRKEILDILSSESEAVIEDAERSAISTVTAHLRPRFDVAAIFANRSIWSRASAYAVNAVVYLDAAEYKPTQSYAQYNLMSYEGEVYMNAGATPITGALNLASWTKLGRSYAFFKALAAVSAGTTLITDGASWSPGDPRNAKIKDIVIDLLLYDIYSNHSLRQIPDHRIDRQANAMAYLKELRDGKLEDPELPLRLDEEGLPDRLFVSGGKPRFASDY